MAYRLFENAEQTKLYLQYRIKAPETLVERVVNFLKEKYSGELDLAIDVGCGSGQNTCVVANYFKKVIGTDVSLNQITNARAVNTKDNVTFEMSPAEEMSQPDGSVQLITAMAAAHWFDLPKFFEEGRRVLSPGGVMALYSYSFAEHLWSRNPSRNEAIKKAQQELAQESAISEFWAAPARVHVMSSYRTITIPYDDLVRDEEAVIFERQLSLPDLMSAIRTWSAFESFKQAKGEEAADAILLQFKNRIIGIIKEDLNPEEESDQDKIILVQKTPICLVMARKPLA